MTEQIKNLLKVYKFNASSVGKLAGDGRKGRLTESALSYVSEVIIELLYGRRKEVTTVAMEKGIENELEAIEILSRYLGQQFEKNTTKYENEYFVGIPDVVNENYIIDIKTPESIFTFPKFKIHDGDLLSSSYYYMDYYWQLQVYMDLLDRNESYLAFVLTDTPERMLLNKEKKQYYTLLEKGLTDEEIESELQKYRSTVLINYVYPDLDVNERVCMIKVTRDREALSKIKSKIDYIRNEMWDDYKIGDET